MLHEILLSLWGCSTSVAEIVNTDVSIFNLLIFNISNLQICYLLSCS